MSATQQKIWCDDDKHFQYEYFSDFNEWLDADGGEPHRIELGVDGLSQPNKALFASDREAYDQTFIEFRNERRHEALNKHYFTEQFASEHWFQRNLDHLIQLIDLMANDAVVPFIGAGVSVSGGFPTWETHLREQGVTANSDSGHIEALLDKGDYESVLEEIEQARGREVFIQEMKDVFSRTGSITDTVWRISELFKDTLITTNYDHLLEQAYDTGEKDSVQIINGTNALEKAAPNKTTIIKLHGDIRKPERCILSKNQYDDAYGVDLDIKRSIPKLLSYYYKNSSLLFLGCSLNNDRTVHVFREIKTQLGEEAQIPQHFSIEQAPEDPEALATRNAYLLQLGITPIWFEKERYESIENILRLAKSELSYRGVVPERQEVKTPEMESIKTVNINLELDLFLHDFVELMPLMHWLHQSIPQKETGKYLHALQRVFHADSLFTEQTNKHLTHGLDHLLRALSNNPQFDGYTHGKLSGAFSSFQHYFETKGVRNYVGDKLNWDYHELFTIPQLQFDEVLALDINEFDRHAIRLIKVLLRHGKNQQHSPKDFCKLPEAINHEFGDYLSLVLLSRLGLSLPDRLEDFANDSIHGLCKDAWDNFDQAMKLGFIERVRLALRF